MKESTQTLLFIGAAVASVFVAMASRPSDATFDPEELIGESLFAPFEAEEAQSLRIVRFDEETATLNDFEVAEQEGVWSLPSKGGYPADAEEQVAKAATGVMDLEILDIATRSAADHADFGVVEPSSSLDVGQTGVGTKVTVTGADGEALVDVVVGKEVKGADDQHYVRRTSQDVVFVVSIKPEDFSTTFEDWIQDDLLDLSPWDIRRVRVRDYSAELVMQGFRPALALDPRADLAVVYDDEESQWLPLRLQQFNREANDYEDFQLSGEEELNKEALDDLKDAVDDLRIVDVERKPAGLSADLKAGDTLFEDRGSVESLMRRGFAATATESGETEVLSSEGEVFVTLKDGVEYVLRFGKLKITSSDESSGAEAGDAADGDEAGDSEDEGDSGVSRYLFVMARFNEEVLDQPELEELPAESEAEEADSESEEGEAAEAEEGEGAEDADNTEDERAEVEQRNARALAEYEQKVADAKKRVEELNDRFGDWYYVIADDVYKKIAIGRDDLVSAKEPSDNEAADTEANTPKTPFANGIPGLPDVPGVDFDPAGAAEAEAAEDEAPAEGADEPPAEAAGDSA